MNALVIGYGSIGSRHAKILKSLGYETFVVSKHGCSDHPSFSSVAKALSAHHFDYAVIANKTSEHLPALLELQKGHRGAVLIEKPVFSELSKKIPDISGFAHVAVAYNLRFHPLLLALRKMLEGEKILTAQIYVGQYLPLWRKSGRDYKDFYSISKALGGGVLRDLSHELDYIQWMMGELSCVAALSGHLSSLAGDSEDTVAILARTPRVPMLTLQMNYLDRQGRREILINTDAKTLHADLIRNTLTDGSETISYAVEIDSTYRMQHEALRDNRFSLLCSFAEGLKTLEIIDNIEKLDFHS